jgi:hypothetical protein
LTVFPHFFNQQIPLLFKQIRKTDCNQRSVISATSKLNTRRPDYYDYYYDYHEHRRPIGAYVSRIKLKLHNNFETFGEFADRYTFFWAHFVTVVLSWLFLFHSSWCSGAASLMRASLWFDLSLDALGLLAVIVAQTGRARPLTAVV